jgi:LysR family transcriptional regulator, glycine cleavage system transcriptional activator
MMLRMRRAYTPSLPELQAFVQAAKTASATQAGDALGLTQSAISRSLASLEARLGVQLFVRARQRLTLSDAGRAFLPQAQAILAQLDAAALGVMSFGGQRQVIRIACLPSFAAVWLIPRLATFMAAHPDVAVDVSATLTPLDFATDARDAAIVRGPVSGPCDVLADERLIVVAAPHLAATLLDDAAIARLPLLQQATRPDLWLQWFGTGQVARGPRFEQFGMVLAAARAGLGVGLVPQVLAAPDIATGTLRQASARTMATQTPYVLTYAQRSQENAAFVALRAHLTHWP